MERCRYLDFRVFFEEGAQPSLRLLGYGYLLRGARGSGKTSLAFQAAINTVLDGGRVVVMCCETLLYAKLPQPFRLLSTLSEEVLNRIEFIYVDSWTGVMAELTQFVHLSHLPTLLIIDDDGFPADPSDKVDRMALCLSYLHNITDWARRSSIALLGTPAPEQGSCAASKDVDADSLNMSSSNDTSNTTATRMNRGSFCNPSNVFFYVVVTNRLAELREQRLPLPYAAFPMVDLYFTAPTEMNWTCTDGEVPAGDATPKRSRAAASVVVLVMTPAAIDAGAASVTLRLKWDSHLCLV